jgi:hypothetical protein
MVVIGTSRSCPQVVHHEQEPAPNPTGESRAVESEGKVKCHQIRGTSKMTGNMPPVARAVGTGMLQAVSR